MSKQNELTLGNYKMAAESAGGLALIKVYGIKAALGMLGAAMLYMVLPPVKQDGSFDKREFVARLACAGLFSMIFGDWAIQLLDVYLPQLHAVDHTAPIYLMVGAPGWWISRAVALWFQRRREKDIRELVDDARKP